MNIDKCLILNEIKSYYGEKTDADFARFLGIKPQTLSSWYSRNTFDIELLYAKCVEIDANYLLTGRGEMLRNANQNVYKLPHAHVPKSVVQLSESQRKDTKNIYTNEKKIPLYSAEAAAGHGSFSESLNNEMIIGYYDVPEFNSADFLIYITGNSMTPKYTNGDIVAAKIIHEPQFLQWGRPHIIATRDQGLLCKRVYKSGLENNINVVSENPTYDKFDIPFPEILGLALIIGVIHHE